MMSKRYLHPHVTAAMFAITKTGKQPKCHPQMKKLSNIGTMEYYPAIAKEEILPSVTTWKHSKDFK